MSAKHLSLRSNWQFGARVIGDKGETALVSALAKHLPDHYEITLKPKKLKVYGRSRGIILDAVIRNNRTGKKLFLEKKTGNNGGNAHERVYKFLSLPLQEKVRKDYGTVTKPFFFVFSGKTFQKQKYINEFSLLLKGENYAIMSEDFSNIDAVAQQIMEIV